TGGISYERGISRGGQICMPELSKGLERNARNLPQGCASDATLLAMPPEEKGFFFAPLLFNHRGSGTNRHHHHLERLLSQRRFRSRKVHLHHTRGRRAGNIRAV